MSKDLANSKESDKYFDARNIRILASDDNTTFAIQNEAGTELTYNIPTPEIDIQNARFTYDVNGVDKSLYYKATGSELPRCQIEDEYWQPNDPDEWKSRDSGEQKIINITNLRDSALVVTSDGNGVDCFWELKDLSSGEYELELLYLNNLGFTTAKPSVLGKMLAMVTHPILLT